MTSGSVQTKGIAETFDDLAHDRCCKYKSNGLTASNQVLLDFISNKGLGGKTVLELGCGTSFFSLQTLLHGAASCLSVNISSAAIHESNDISKKSVMQYRVSFDAA